MSASRLFSSTSARRNLINGNTEFNAHDLAKIQGMPDPTIFYSFIIDSILPDAAPGQMTICELQPGLSSELPKDVIDAMVTLLDGKRPVGGKFIYLDYHSGFFKHSIDIESDKVEIIPANYLDEPDEVADSIILFAGAISQINSHDVRARYKEITSLRSNPTSFIFYDKVIQRILLSMIAPHLNPDHWHAFTKDTPPTIAEIKQAFPNGYIIKSHNGTRGEGVTTAAFKTDAELHAYLSSVKANFFVIESFVKGTKKHNDKTHTAARRWCCTHIDNDTFIHGAIDQLAPIALETLSSHSSSEDDKIDHDLVRVSHSKSGHPSIELRPDLNDEHVEGYRLQIANLMREIEKIEPINLLNYLLEQENTVYQKLAINIILNVEKIYYYGYLFYPEEYCDLIANFADKFNTLLKADELEALKKILTNMNTILEDPSYESIFYGRNAPSDFAFIKHAVHDALKCLLAPEQEPTQTIKLLG